MGGGGESRLLLKWAGLCGWAHDCPELSFDINCVPQSVDPGSPPALSHMCTQIWDPLSDQRLSPDDSSVPGIL